MCDVAASEGGWRDGWRVRSPTDHRHDSRTRLCDNCEGLIFRGGLENAFCFLRGVGMMMRADWDAEK